MRSTIQGWCESTLCDLITVVVLSTATLYFVCVSVCVYRDPGQLFSTSNTLLLKVVTLQVSDDGSGSDDTTSVNSEGEVGPK